MLGREPHHRLSRTDHLEVKSKVMFYLSVQRYDAAEKLLKATLVEFQKNASLINLLGVTYHKQARFADAIKQFKTALQSNPSFVEAALNLASTLCDLSRYEEAKAVYDQLTDAMHSDLKIPQLVVGRLANQHVENARVYEQAGLHEDAIREYSRAVQLFPKLPDARFDLAKLLLQQNEMEKSRTILEELVSVYPEMSRALNLLGIVYLKVGREDLAKQAWQKSANSNPDDVISRVLMNATSSRNTFV